MSTGTKSEAKTAKVQHRTAGERGETFWAIDLSDRPTGWPLAKWKGPRSLLTDFLQSKGYAVTFLDFDGRAEAR